MHPPPTPPDPFGRPEPEHARPQRHCSRPGQFQRECGGEQHN